MTLTPPEPRFHPVFTVVTFRAQSGLFQQNIVSARGNYALFASHHDMRATRVSHATIYHSLF